MKLAVFSLAGARRLGVVQGDVIVDISGAGGLADLEAWLDAGEGALERAQRLAETGEPIALSRVTLHAPVRRPSKFLAIAANYQSHIDEVLANNPAYTPPVYQRWFAKLPSCINDPFAPILMPPEVTDLDYEAELAIIIGRRCRRVKAEDAASVIAGYTVNNDVSARDWQKRSPTIMLGKSFDSHGPLGPWMVTPDEVGDPHALAVTCTVNGELRQSGNTSQMINSCFEQIAYLSTVCTLEPGDVIATGTPAGTGAAMKPSGLLRIGDVVRCEVERVGAIEAVVRREIVVESRR
jgi:2-keto-4-pentenoate hydratase/2-oxohepta-3-ene-1,7-dioic acid hydratase in catechol pathway